MSGENRLKRDQRKQRQEALYSELQFADAGEVLEIDRQRRKRGERPSSFGLAIEGTFARSRPPDFVPGRYSTAPDRPDYGDNLSPIEPPLQALRRTPGEAGQQKLEDFHDTLRRAGLPDREPTDFERQQIDLAAETEVGAERAQQFAPGGGLRLAGGIGTVLDEFMGEPIRGAVSDPLHPIQGAIRALRSPERVSGRDIALAARLPDKDFLPFDLSARDVVGGIQEAVFDIGAVGGLAKLPLRAAGRAAGMEAAETSTRGLLRPRGAAGAVEPVIPGQQPGLRRAVSGGAVTPATVTRPAYAQPPPTAQALFGLEAFEVGLSRFDETMNSIAETLGRAPVREQYATPALREAQRVGPRIAAVAERLGAVADSLVNDAFDIDKRGRISSLAGIDQSVPGAPTLADIAARLPNYEAVLTPAQREALDKLQRELAPYRQMLDEVGVEVGSRPDVMDGGFYIPRGGADIEGIDQPLRPRGRGRMGGKTGSERTSTFASQAEGIEAGFEYAPVGDALRTYSRGIGQRAVDRHVLNYFLALEEGGIRLARSAVDEMDPTLRARWQTLRASIAGARQTARRRTVRTTERMGEAARRGREEVAAEGRVERAGRSANEQVLADVLGRTLATPELHRQHAAALRGRIVTTASGTPSRSATNRQVMQELGETEALADIRSALDAHPNDLDAALAQIEAQAERAGNYVQTRSDPSLRAQARQDARLEGRSRGGVLRGAGSLNASAPIEGPLEVQKAYADTLARSLDAGGRRLDVMAEASTDDVIKAAERELRVLQRESRRAATRARGASGRAGRAMAAEAETRQRLDSLLQQQDALRADYQRAQRKAAETPRGRGRIEGAPGHTFPEALADAVSDALRKQQPGRGLSADLQALNAVMRGFKATGEFSHLSIQLAIGAVRSPRRYGRATVIAMKAMKNPRVVGAYLRNFDATRPTQGLPTSRIWASRGLQIGGSQTEFQVARSGPLSPGRIPGVGRATRAFDRNFGVAGDVMRLELADAEAEFSLRSGRILDDTELDRIAQTANRMTGWSPSTGFASRADAALATVNFAPRFLRARIEAVAQLGSRDPRMRQLARRTIGRYIAVATAMTVLINEANGERTDFNPVRNFDGRWVKNGNFVRVRNIAGRDWSFLGAIDGLLGIAVGVGDVPLALAAAPSAGRGATKERLVGDVSSLITAPLLDFVRTLWTGRNAIGEPTGIPELLMESVLPIGYIQGAEGIGQVRDAQTPEGKAAAVAGGLGEAAIGLRASPLSVTERLDLAAREMGLEGTFAAAPDDPRRIKASDAQAVLDANPDLAQRRTEERVERGSEAGQNEQAKATANAAKQAAVDRLEAGETGPQYVLEVFHRQDQMLAGKRDLIYGDEGPRPDDPNETPENRYYAAISRAEGADGEVDWEQVDAWRATIDPTDDKRIDEETGTGDIPYVRRVTAIRKSLDQTGYYDSRNKAWEQVIATTQVDLSSFGAAAENPADWWSRRDAEVAWLAGEKRAEGLAPGIAWDQAQDEVAGYGIVEQFNEFYRTEFRHQWVVDNKEIAREAWELGLFDPDKAETEFLLGMREAR